MISFGHITNALGHRNAVGILVAGLVLLVGAAVVGSVFLFSTPKEVVVEEPAPQAPSPYDRVVLRAEAAIVYDLATGEVLYEKNSEAQLPLASLTKLLTLYAAAEVMPRDASIQMTSEALSADGDSGFSEGEHFTFEELAKLALVASSNDAAEAIALAAGERRGQDGASLLASAASAAGLSQTYTLNGTGLDESTIISGGYGSARDMALLSAEFLKRVPGIARATLDPSVTANSMDGRSYTLKNTNPDVGQIPGLRLSKTGFTDLAGGNLAIVFDVGLNHPIAIVVLGSTREGRFTDVDRLVKATTAQFASMPLP